MALETSSATLLTTDEVADYLRLSPHTIRKYVTRRLLSPTRKIGASYLFSRTECDRFKRNRRPRGNPHFKKAE